MNPKTTFKPPSFKPPSFIGSLTEAATSAASAATDAAKHTMADKIYTLQTQATEAANDAINKTIYNDSNALQSHVTSEANNVMDNASNALQSHVTSEANNVMDNASTALQSHVTSEAKNAMNNTINNASNALQSHVTDGLSGINSTATDAAKKFMHGIPNTTDATIANAKKIAEGLMPKNMPSMSSFKPPTNPNAALASVATKVVPVVLDVVDKLVSSPQFIKTQTTDIRPETEQNTGIIMNDVKTKIKVDDIAICINNYLPEYMILDKDNKLKYKQLQDVLYIIQTMLITAVTNEQKKELFMEILKKKYNAISTPNTSTQKITGGENTATKRDYNYVINYVKIYSKNVYFQEAQNTIIYPILDAIKQNIESSEFKVDGVIQQVKMNCFEIVKSQLTILYTELIDKLDDNGIHRLHTLLNTSDEDTTIPTTQELTPTATEPPPPTQGGVGDNIQNGGGSYEQGGAQPYEPILELKYTEHYDAYTSAMKILDTFITMTKEAVQTDTFNKNFTQYIQDCIISVYRIENTQDMKESLEILSNTFVEISKNAYDFMNMSNKFTILYSLIDTNTIIQNALIQSINTNIIHGNFGGWQLMMGLTSYSSQLTDTYSAFLKHVQQSKSEIDTTTIKTTLNKPKDIQIEIKPCKQSDSITPKIYKLLMDLIKFPKSEWQPVINSNVLNTIEFGIKEYIKKDLILDSTNSIIKNLAAQIATQYLNIYSDHKNEHYTDIAPNNPNVLENKFRDSLYSIFSDNDVMDKFNSVLMHFSDWVMNSPTFKQMNPDVTIRSRVILFGAMHNLRNYLELATNKDTNRVRIEYSYNEHIVPDSSIYTGFDTEIDNHELKTYLIAAYRNAIEHINSNIKANEIKNLNKMAEQGAVDAEEEPMRGNKTTGGGRKGKGKPPSGFTPVVGNNTSSVPTESTSEQKSQVNNVLIVIPDDELPLYNQECNDPPDTERANQLVNSIGYEPVDKYIPPDNKHIHLDTEEDEEDDDIAVTDKLVTPPSTTPAIDTSTTVGLPNPCNNDQTHNVGGKLCFFNASFQVLFQIPELNIKVIPVATVDGKPNPCEIVSEWKNLYENWETIKTKQQNDSTKIQTLDTSVFIDKFRKYVEEKKPGDVLSIKDRNNDVNDFIEYLFKIFEECLKPLNTDYMFNLLYSKTIKDVDILIWLLAINTTINNTIYNSINEYINLVCNLPSTTNPPEKCLKSLPTIIFMRLPHYFSSDTKDLKPFTFENNCEINLSQYVIDADPNAHKYRLFGVINYMGDGQHGHYTAYIRKNIEENEWVKCDDKTITNINESEIKSNKDAYILVWRRIERKIT